MEKYKSNLIDLEKINVETKNEYDKFDNRFFIVTLTIIESGITATSKANTSQIAAYNECLKELEFKYILDELDTYQKALEFVKAERDVYKERSRIMCDIFMKQVKMFESAKPDEKGEHVLRVNHESLIKLKYKLLRM